MEREQDQKELKVNSSANKEKGKEQPFMGKSFYHEHLFLLKQIINSHQYKYIYNLHLFVRPTFKSKNEMGSHVVSRGQVVNYN